MIGNPRAGSENSMEARVSSQRKGLSSDESRNKLWEHACVIYAHSRRRDKPNGTHQGAVLDWFLIIDLWRLTEDERPAARLASDVSIAPRVTQMTADFLRSIVLRASHADSLYEPSQNGYDILSSSCRLTGCTSDSGRCGVSQSTSSSWLSSLPRLSPSHLFRDGY